MLVNNISNDRQMLIGAIFTDRNQNFPCFPIYRPHMTEKMNQIALKSPSNLARLYRKFDLSTFLTGIFALPEICGNHERGFYLVRKSECIETYCIHPFHKFLQKQDVSS